MTDSYHSFLIIIGFSLIYSLTAWLAKKGKIKLISHRQLWNLILLISFLLSGLLGIWLAVMIDFKSASAWYHFLLWLHVETGLIMAVAGVCHAWWHLDYYRQIIRKKFKS